MMVMFTAKNGIVDTTGTHILKPIIIIDQIYVEVNVIIQSDIFLCDVTFICKFISEQTHRKLKKVVAVGIDIQ